MTGEPKKVYDGWKYPEEWDVEGFAQEGPKMLRHGGYYYMVLAEGGTAGPPTSHMVVVARSKSIHGPWENSPHNPIVRTKSRDEYWWSKGHATMFEGPGGQWYFIYHGYENGYWTLGRQTLLEPATWTADGWLTATGIDMSKPIPMPKGQAVPHGFAFSDDFSTNKMGRQWNFYDGDNTDTSRYRYENGALVVKGKGSSPKDASPLSFVSGDQAYEIQVDLELSAGATAGLLTFYNGRLYAGLGYNGSNFVFHRYGTERQAVKVAGEPRRILLRLRNDHHVVTMWHSVDGGSTWTKFDNQVEVSAYHHNVAYDFLSLRPAIYAAGTGEVRFRDFRYRRAAVPFGTGTGRGGNRGKRCERVTRSSTEIACCGAGNRRVRLHDQLVLAGRVVGDLRPEGPVVAAGVLLTATPRSDPRSRCGQRPRAAGGPCRSAPATAQTPACPLWRCWSWSRRPSAS